MKNHLYKSFLLFISLLLYSNNIAQTTFDFGEVVIGQSATKTFLFRNTTSATIVISKIVSDLKVFTVDPTTATIPVGSTQIFTIRFRPSTAIYYSGKISISHNSWVIPNPLILTVTGTGIIPLPNKPILLSPPNNSIDVSINPTLSWQAANGATSYELKVYNISGVLIFSYPNLIGTSQQIGPLQYEAEYVWVVSGKNSTGEGPPSDAFKFKTFASSGYIQNLSSFPAYPYNTSSYMQGGAYVGCGPTTGAMIFGYYEHVEGMSAGSGLLTNPGIGVNEGLNTAWVLHGSSYMNTLTNGYGSQYKIEPGLEGYAEDRGYVIDVMIHVSPTYDPSSTAWQDYGPYGTSWLNDGIFWTYSGGIWGIDANKFCDFVSKKLASGIAIFLTIDTDMDGSGDHWVPLVGYDRSTFKYAYYDTYSTSLHWADIYYCGSTPKKDNAISLLRTVEYNGLFPVELTLFTAEVNKNGVNLKWQTATEVNNYGFDIERKISDTWVKIGFVAGNGNSNSPKEYSYVDKSLVGGSKFQYRLKQIDNDGQFEYSDEVEVELVPTEFALYQNYPNPFNPTTTIRYQLPKESKVVIKIYNVLGAEVIELLNEQKEAGIYEVELNANNLSSGTYIYKISADNFVQTKKMILLK